MGDLNNLNHENVNALIADTLCLPYLETYALTAFIHEKTEGNPFYVRQMLKSIYEQGLIFFSNQTLVWKWDASIFDGEDINKSVIELLKKKILTFDQKKKILTFDQKKKKKKKK